MASAGAKAAFGSGRGMAKRATNAVSGLRGASAPEGRVSARTRTARLGSWVGIRHPLGAIAGRGTAMGVGIARSGAAFVVSVLVVEGKATRARSAGAPVGFSSRQAFGVVPSIVGAGRLRLKAGVGSVPARMAGSTRRDAASAAGVRGAALMAATGARN